MMRGLSLWEPWASAMAAGFKANETRSWPTSYRGDLLICAGKKIITYPLVFPNEVLSLKLHHGSAVCVVDLYDCLPMEDLVYQSQLEYQLGDYSAGRFAWLTRNLRKLPVPVPWTGRQGMWRLTTEEEAKIRSML